MLLVVVFKKIMDSGAICSVINLYFTLVFVLLVYVIFRQLESKFEDRCSQSKGAGSRGFKGPDAQS